MAAAPPFALAPGLVNVGVINFGTQDGKALYKQATKSVMPNDDQYDGSAEKLQNFLYWVGVRADIYGWGDDGILNIDTNVGGAVPTLVNMLQREQYPVGYPIPPAENGPHLGHQETPVVQFLPKDIENQPHHKIQQ